MRNGECGMQPGGFGVVVTDSSSLTARSKSITHGAAPIPLGDKSGEDDDR